MPDFKDDIGDDALNAVVGGAGTASAAKPDDTWTQSADHPAATPMVTTSYVLTPDDGGGGGDAPHGSAGHPLSGTPQAAPTSSHPPALHGADLVRAMVADALHNLPHPGSAAPGGAGTKKP